MNKARIDRFVSALRSASLPQMLVVDPMSIYYLTGYYNAPFERFFALYVSETRFTLILNRLFPAPADREIECVWYSDTDSVPDLLATLLRRDQALGVDKDLRAKFLLPMIERRLAASFADSSWVLDELRGCKDAEEQALMRDASRINAEAMLRFRALIHEGVTEKEVADQTLAIYQELGAEGFSFSPLIAFGPNAADPHHSPDDTPLREGDCVLFDVGCVKNGYCSDMTRTYFYKSVSPEHRRVYELVRAANEAAIREIRPGREIHILDDTARGLIAEGGFVREFNHRLGHFIGLSEHEAGDVSAVNTALLRPGMVFSIEPGIYLEGDVGVRIEDLVLVTEDGCEVLNRVSKELEILG